MKNIDDAESVIVSAKMGLGALFLTGLNCDRKFIGGKADGRGA
jgi:hypothetical protein